MHGVFNRNEKNHLERKMWFDGPVEIARYEHVKYPVLDELTDKMHGFFWRPTEVDVTKDKIDFATLEPHEEHIFTSNLKRQILLDSVQGRAPAEAFLPIASLPELEPLILTWSMFETIHSRAYTHIIRNVYPNPSLVFDEMLNIKEIIDCSEDISRHYNELLYLNDDDFSLYGNHTHKKALWLALNSVNVLEGIRFYVSFACSWAFAEPAINKMEGNAKLIKLICRDENVHLATTQTLLRLMRKDDPEFEEIRTEMTPIVTKMFVDAIEQEKAWAKFLFQDGSILGLNESILSEYIEWIGTRRIRALGYDSPYSVSKTNPLPWTEKWISGSNVQPAAQETQITSYLIGGVDQNLTPDFLKQFEL